MHAMTLGASITALSTVQMMAQPITLQKATLHVSAVCNTAKCISLVMSIWLIMPMKPHIVKIRAAGRMAESLMTLLVNAPKPKRTVTGAVIGRVIDE